MLERFVFCNTCRYFLFYSWVSRYPSFRKNSLVSIQGLSAFLRKKNCIWFCIKCIENLTLSNMVCILNGLKELCEFVFKIFTGVQFCHLNFQTKKVQKNMLMTTPEYLSLMVVIMETKLHVMHSNTNDYLYNHHCVNY